MLKMAGHPDLNEVTKTLIPSETEAFIEDANVVDARNLHVAVIGIGTAGVSALRWCKARGMPVMGFERESGCGGIWRWGSKHSPAYDSLYTNSSGIMMSLGDFSRRFQGKFPPHKETVDYYTEYMELNKLKSLVRWNTVVDRVYKDEGRWVVEYRDVNEGNPHTPPKMDYFDRVIIATGKLWDPCYPEWAQGYFPRSKSLANPSSPIVEKQGITLLHSREYRNPTNFAGKRVVVVGVGNSSLDISLELAKDENVRKPVLVACRRGTVVMPIADKRGDPVDPVMTSRAFQYLASPSARGLTMRKAVHEVNHRMKQLGLPLPPDAKNYFAVENPVANLKDSYGYIEALEKGWIKFVDGVEGIHEDAPKTLKMSNGSLVEDVDAVIFGTGYRVGMDFLDPAIRNKVVKHVIQKNGRKTEYVDLFRSVLYPDDPTIAFLVLVTSYGNESVVGSMQARWVTRFWADKEFARKHFSLTKFAKESSNRYKSIVGSSTPNPFFVRYLPYMDEMARDLGVLPDIKSMMSSPSQFLMGLQLLFGPSVAAQYFISGPDASEQAREFLSKL